MRQAAAIMNISMALALPLAGCTPTPCASSFSRNEADAVMSVQFGTVAALREVERRRHKAPSQSFPQGGVADEGGPDTTRPGLCAAGTGGVKDGTHRAASAGLGRPRARGREARRALIRRCRARAWSRL